MDINFGMPNLLILNLAYNKIDTLESLQKMSFISLRELHLCMLAFKQFTTISPHFARSAKAVCHNSPWLLSVQPIFDKVSNVLLDLKGIEEWNCPKL